MRNFGTKIQLFDYFFNEKQNFWRKISNMSQNNFWTKTKTKYFLRIQISVKIKIFDTKINFFLSFLDFGAKFQLCF